MKKGLILLLLLQVAICAKGQIVEPEYIGQAYVLLQNGQRVELDSELGYVSANTNTTTHAATTRHNIWGLFNPLLSASGYSVAQSYGKSVDYLNLPGESSPNQFRVREPFSIYSALRVMPICLKRKLRCFDLFVIKANDMRVLVRWCRFTPLRQENPPIRSC